MSKVKKYSRQLMVLFVALATVLTCMLAFTPEADAGATQYKWRVTHTLGQGNNHTEGCYIRLYYKTNNGTGSESYIDLEGDTDAFDKDCNGNYYWISDSSVTASGKRTTTKSIPANAFPTRVYTYVFCEDPGTGSYQEFRWTSTLEVFDQSGTCIASVTSGEKKISGASSNQSLTSDISISTANYPYVNDWSITGSYPVYINRDGSSVSQTVTVSAVDNYGVNWVNAPTITGSNITVTNGSTTTPTLTFANQSADYTGSITCKWTTANTSNATVSKSASTDVYVPHSLTVDANNGTYGSTNPITGKYTNETATLATPTRTAYTFSSWTKTAGNGSLSGNTFTFGNNSATVKANWTPNSYTITPVYDTTTYPAVSYNIESTSISLPTPTKTGYTFAGWVVSAADGNWSVGDKVTSNPSGKYGNITIAPTWTANNYSVIFDDNLFDYLAWKNTGITGSRAEITDITDKGFTVTSTEGNDGYCAFSNPSTAVEGSTEYTLSADIDYTGEAEYDIFVQFLDTNGAHIEYRNVHTDTFTFTTPANCGFIKIRFDANLAGNVLRAENIRLYKSGTGYNNISCVYPSTVTYDGTYGELPVPTKPHYDFVGWFRTDGTQLTADETVKITENLKVYSKWTPAKYNITFNTDGGNTLSAMTYTIEDTSVSLPTPLKTGYTFSHWIVETQNGNWTAGATVSGALSSNYGDVGLKAVYTPNNYTLNFDLNKADGAVTEPACDKSSIGVTFDAAVGTLPVPTLDGYDFAGWYTAAGGGTLYTASTVYTTADDSTVFAHWTPHTHSIITDANGGDEVADGTYTIIEGSIPAGGTRTGYTFSHWEVAEDAGNWVAGTEYNPGDSTVGMYGDVTLKAIWTANDYTVSFDLNDTTGIGSATADKTTITATYDSALNVNEDLPVVTRNGYDFVGWFTKADGGDEVNAETVYKTAGETTYFAHWETVTYTVSFDVNNGNAMEPIEYTIEDELILPESTRTGYTFASWFYNQVTTGSWKRNTTYNKDALTLGTGNWGNVTLKANYTVNQYEITWVINGVSETTLHNYNTIPAHADPTVLTDPYYEYEFTGWEPAIAVVTGNATYTATFTKSPKSYKVVWVDENGNELHSGLLGYGETIPTSVLDVPAKTGYTGEWDYSGNTTMPAENLVVRPVYTPVKYPVHWEVEGTVIKTDMVDFDSLPSYSGETPTKAEDAMYTYTFSKWTPEIVIVNGETTYVAEFSATPKEYTVTWVANGTTVTSYKLAYGSAVTNIPAVPEILGMVGSWEGIPETMPANDITINAKYVKGCLVTWYLDGTATGAYYQLGFENGEQIAYNRSNPEKLADAEYTYTFEGWSETEGGELITSYPVAGETDLSYYAVYSKTPNEYTITWEAEGVEILKETLAFGSDIENVPEIPAKTGHTGKWVGVPYTMPAENVKVIAEYAPIDYTITWVIGENTYETTFAYGTTPVCSQSTDRASSLTTDYTFICWDKPVVVVNGDATYTAQYSESARKYTVTWEYEDGTLIDTDSVANGTEITYIPAIADKEGHDPVYVIPDVMPTNDITIVVTYEAKSYTVKWSTPSGVIEETWKYGETPEYDTAKYGVPEKEATAEKQYAFLGWNPTVSTVKGDVTYVAMFTETARKYTVVWYVDGEFYETRDIAFGGIIPTLTVPQKDGYTGIWDNPYRTMPAKDLTINTIYTAKKYTVYWKVDGLTVYSASVSFGDPIPNQKVPEKEGCSGIWVNVPEKMPAENVTITAEYTAKEYTVTWRFDGVTNTGTATYGVDFTLVFDGDTHPEELKITIGGIEFSADNYTYDAESGELKIPGKSITGDISIVARAAGGKCNLVSNLFGGISSNDVDVIPEREAYFTMLVPYEGYLIPSEVSVYVDGVYLAEGYTYEASTGRLVINAEVVMGEIEIYAEFPVDPDYDPDAEPDAPETNCKCNCHSKSAFTKFFFDIITFLRKLFGMEQYRYCECGAAHW